MKHDRTGSLTRREWLGETGRTVVTGVGSALGGLVSGCGSPSQFVAPVKVGLLHSQTGTMAISETSLRDMEILAIEEINATGGILGRPIEFVLEDGKSRDRDLFPKKAEGLLRDEKVAAVFGCWTSSSRKAVIPLFEKYNGLLFYPVQYEGNESSLNVIYGGSVPNQQIMPALNWLMSPAGGSKKRFYLIGSDYIYPRTANLVLKKYLESKQMPVVGQRYVRLGHEDFKPIIEEIKKSDADVIFSTINGDSNIHFYNQLAEGGIAADRIPVVATSVGEDELRSLLPEAVQGHFSVWNYFQSLNTPENASFVKRFRKEFGDDRVIDDPMESAYVLVYFWKQAVEKAGSFAVDKVRQAMRTGLSVNAPGGKLTLDPKTQHLYKKCRIGRIRDDRQFDIVYESPDSIAPDPYPEVAFPGWNCDWTRGGLTRGSDVELDL